MASSGVNVLRWSALFTGVFYGIYHQSQLSSQQKANEAARQYHNQESLIKKAKAEYVKKTNPGDNGVISDPDDPKFDLEAFLKLKEANES